MSGFSASLLICLLVAATTAQRQPSQRFQCPQDEGSFAYQDDCTRYWRCDNGVASAESCQPRLYFNPDKGYCDWPRNVNSGCREPEDRSLYVPGSENLCDNPPAGLEDQAYDVAHPTFCNAFYTCTLGYLFAPCKFCPQGMYFDELASACRSELGRDLNTECGSRVYVPHDQKVYQTLGDNCWPFQSIANPFGVLAEDFKQKGLLLEPNQLSTGSNSNGRFGNNNNNNGRFGNTNNNSNGRFGSNTNNGRFGSSSSNGRPSTVRM